MNDNHWYPRDPQRFLTDTQWCDSATEVAHNRLTDTYYALGKPIKDIANEISLIGKIERADYARVRGNLERLGWYSLNGELRHKKCEKTMNEMEQNRQSQIRRTAAATASRRPATTNVTTNVTSVVRPIQTNDVTLTQPQPQPDKENTTAPSAVDGDVKKVERTPAQKEAWRQHLLGEDVKIGWRRLFHEICKLDYQMTGVDRGQLKLFVKDTKLSADTILTIAKSALTIQSKPGFSHCRNTKSLAYFCNHFNEIRTEIVESARPNPHPNWPSRIDVARYAKEKGDDRGYWVSWFEFWSKKDFKRGEFTIDWQIELGKQLANRRQPV